jgi:hypothetical protein
MSGKQRPAHCWPNSQSSPAVVCPLDGGVSRHGVLLADSAMVATAERLRHLHATDATDTSAGMGRTADAGRGEGTKQRRRCVLAGPGRRTNVALCAEDFERFADATNSCARMRSGALAAEGRTARHDAGVCSGGASTIGAPAAAGRTARHNACASSAFRAPTLLRQAAHSRRTAFALTALPLTRQDCM